MGPHHHGHGGRGGWGYPIVIEEYVDLPDLPDDTVVGVDTVPSGEDRFWDKSQGWSPHGDEGMK
jgi:hypothetical protein